MKFLLFKLFRNAGHCFQGWTLHPWDSVVLTAPAESQVGRRRWGFPRAVIILTDWRSGWWMQARKEQCSSILAPWGNPSRARRPCISQPVFLLLLRLLMRAAAPPGAKLGLGVQHLIKQNCLFFCVSWIYVPTQWSAILSRYDRIYLELYHTIFYGI